MKELNMEAIAAVSDLNARARIKRKWQADFIDTASLHVNEANVIQREVLGALIERSHESRIKASSGYRLAPVLLKVS